MTKQKTGTLSVLSNLRYRQNKIAAKMTHLHYENISYFNFGGLPEGEQLKIRSLLSGYKLFKIPFLTTFISTKTLYEQI